MIAPAAPSRWSIMFNQSALGAPGAVMFVWAGMGVESGAGILLISSEPRLFEFSKMPGFVGQEWTVYNTAGFSVNVLVVDITYNS